MDFYDELLNRPPCRRVVAPNDTIDRIESTSQWWRCGRRRCDARESWRILEFMFDDSGRIEYKGLNLLLSPRSGRSIAPHDYPSPLIDTRIHLVSFLSAKWPRDPQIPTESFLSDLTPHYLSKFLHIFFSFLYLRKAECTAEGTKGKRFRSRPRRAMEKKERR